MTEHWKLKNIYKRQIDFLHVNPRCCPLVYNPVVSQTNKQTNKNCGMQAHETLKSRGTFGKSCALLLWWHTRKKWPSFFSETQPWWRLSLPNHNCEPVSWWAWLCFLTPNNQQLSTINRTNCSMWSNHDEVAQNCRGACPWLRFPLMINSEFAPHVASFREQCRIEYP